MQKDGGAIKEIPLVDFKAEYKSIRENIDTSIRRVLESGWFVLGPEVENFEKSLGKYLKVDNVVGLASGTDALTIALKTAGVVDGDGVILPANVYPSAFGISLSGAKLQLCDVDPKSLLVTAEQIEKVLDSTTKAVVVVHLYGNPADMDPIVNLCKKQNLVLIEDCAQAIGATYKGRKVGTFGDIGCFSFYPTKNLGAYGDGGALVTQSENLVKTARLLRMYGEVTRYKSVILGHNSRLDEIQAAILSVKLKYLDQWNTKRREIAQKYLKSFSDLPVSLTEQTERGKGVYHLFVLRVKERGRFIKYLKEIGISTGIHYPYPIHEVPAFRHLKYKPEDFPESSKASREVVSLPLYPQATNKDVEYVIESIRRYFNK